jgi:predicted  nucleic acid-binding Zn-ribbon protein
MPRLKCKKCGNVFEHQHQPLDSLIHLGPIRMLKCPACGKSSFFNSLSSVNDPVTWPPQKEKKERPAEPQLSEEEQEKKRIEESKYEKV